MQARALGADVQAWDPDGRPLVGEVGELVIGQPMPSMPVAFWGDADGSRLRECVLRALPRASGATATGSRSPSAERRSSPAAATPRSTAAAIRMGTSEIYRAVLADDAVVDALVVDIPDVTAPRRLDAVVRGLARGRSS